MNQVEATTTTAADLLPLATVLFCLMRQYGKTPLTEEEYEAEISQLPPKKRAYYRNAERRIMADRARLRALGLLPIKLA